MTRNVIVGIVVIVALIAGYFLWRGDGSTIGPGWGNRAEEVEIGSRDELREAGDVVGDRSGKQSVVLQNTAKASSYGSRAVTSPGVARERPVVDFTSDGPLDL